MTTILFHYFHRDEGNWKDHLNAVIDNPNDLPLEEIESRIKSSLIDGNYFYHTDVGLLRSDYAGNNDWHEFACVEETSLRADFLFTVEELLERLERIKPAPPKVHICMMAQNFHFRIWCCNRVCAYVWKRCLSRDNAMDLFYSD